MQSQDILMRAYEVVGEFGITRGAQARTDDGTPVPAHDSRATSFCSIGALTRAALDLGVPTWREEGPFAEAVSLFYEHAHSPFSIVHWNDNVADDATIKATFRKAAGVPEVASVTVEEVPETVVHVTQLACV